MQWKATPWKRRTRHLLVAGQHGHHRPHEGPGDGGEGGPEPRPGKHQTPTPRTSNAQWQASTNFIRCKGETGWALRFQNFMQHNWRCRIDAHSLSIFFADATHTQTSCGHENTGVAHLRPRRGMPGISIGGLGGASLTGTEGEGRAPDRRVRRRPDPRHCRGGDGQPDGRAPGPGPPVVCGALGTAKNPHGPCCDARIVESSQSGPVPGPAGWCPGPWARSAPVGRGGGRLPPRARQPRPPPRRIRGCQRLETCGALRPKKGGAWRPTRRRALASNPWGIIPG